jgi:hypothetical protein
MTGLVKTSLSSSTRVHSTKRLTDLNTRATFVTTSPSPSEMFSAGIPSGLGIALWSLGAGGAGAWFSQ